MALLADGLFWYYGFATTAEHAHGGAASAMFGMVAIVMVINAITAAAISAYYWGTFRAMVAGVVWLFGVGSTTGGATRSSCSRSS